MRVVKKLTIVGNLKKRSSESLINEIFIKKLRQSMNNDEDNTELGWKSKRVPAIIKFIIRKKSRL